VCINPFLERRRLAHHHMLVLAWECIAQDIFLLSFNVYFAHFSHQGFAFRIASFDCSWIRILCPVDENGRKVRYAPPPHTRVKWNFEFSHSHSPPDFDWDRYFLLELVPSAKIIRLDEIHKIMKL
jgi:hypothetical protein